MLRTQAEVPTRLARFAVLDIPFAQPRWHSDYPDGDMNGGTHYPGTCGVESSCAKGVGLEVGNINIVMGARPVPFG